MHMPNNTLRGVKQYMHHHLATLFVENECNYLFFIVLEEVLGIKKTQYMLQPEQRISESEIVKVVHATKRLKSGEPWQYIVGKVEFAGVEITVSPATLIPRPETEELVALFLQAESATCRKVLDVCSGSGCIAVALAKQLPQAQVSAIDISTEALAIAQRNAQKNGVEVQFTALDFLTETTWEQFTQPFDCILSNPPYVTPKEQQQMAANVLNFEPHLALFVTESDPLVFYRKLRDFSLIHLKKGGKLYLEINQYLGPETLALFQSNQFTATLHNDLSGNQRFVIAEKRT